MKSKQEYEAPEAAVFVLRPESVVCQSYRPLSFGDENESGNVDDGNYYDGGSF